MIKSKKSLFFIVPVFLVVWAILGYRVYILFFSADKNVNPLVYSRSEPKKTGAENSYVPSMDYPDPFLKSRIEGKGKQNATVKKQKTDETKYMPVKPDVKYIGIISSGGNAKQAIVKLRGVTRIVETGDSIENVMIYAIYSDSLIVAQDNYKWSYSFTRDKNGE